MVESAELSSVLPIWQRIRALVSTRPLTVDELAEELSAKPESVSRIVRKFNIFHRGDDDKVRLATTLEGPSIHGTI